LVSRSRRTPEDEDVGRAVRRLIVHIVDDRSLPVVLLAALINIAMWGSTTLTGQPMLSAPVIDALCCYDLVAIGLAIWLMCRRRES
jgi:hypothetical protein